MAFLDMPPGLKRPDLLDGPVVDAVALAQLARGEAVADGADFAHFFGSQDRLGAGRIVGSGHGGLCNRRPGPRWAAGHGAGRVLRGLAGVGRADDAVFDPVDGDRLRQLGRFLQRAADDHSVDGLKLRQLHQHADQLGT